MSFEKSRYWTRGIALTALLASEPASAQNEDPFNHSLTQEERATQDDIKRCIESSTEPLSDGSGALSCNGYNPRTVVYQYINYWYPGNKDVSIASIRQEGEKIIFRLNIPVSAVKAEHSPENF